jgi:TPR repeat protein
MNNIYLNKKYLKYKSKYLHLKNQIGGISIPFCEKAYKNVLRTCWAVAIQTMFTFSDTTSEDLKTVMKSIHLDSENLSFYEITEKKKKFIDDRVQVVQTNILLNSFYRLFNNYYPDYFYKGKKKEYLNKILNKFIDRYYRKILEINNSQKSEEIDDTINLERCELVIAQNFKGLFEYSLLKYITDYQGNIITIYLFSNLLSVFFLDYKVSIKNYYNNFNSINFNREKDIGILIHIESHVCCLYICGGQQKYYNDVDKKVHNCEWIDLLKTPNNLYVEYGENFRLIDYNTYENKHKLKKVVALTVVSKHTRDSDLDIEIKKILNFTEFNPSDFKDRNIQNTLANIFSNDHLGVTQNWVMSVQWYRLAAAQGDMNAMINLGSILSKGVSGIAQDKQEAMQFYQLASKNGDGYASLVLADMFYNGDDVAEDKEKAVRLYRLSAEQTNVTAQFKLANILLNDGNIEEAIKWYENAATYGNLDALFKLGDMSYKGEGLEQSNYNAVHNFKIAANRGHVEAKLKLGDYYNSVGQKKEALNWYGDAAKYKNADAQFKLGDMYYSGEAEKIYKESLLKYDIFSSVLYDSKKTLLEHKLEAEKWYSLAAKQGHIEAQKKLDVINFNKELELAKNGDVNSQTMVGFMFKNGKGITQNDVEAARWYQLAADKGNSYSQNELGLMFLNGIGVTQDYNEAVKLFRLAVDQGNLYAQSNLGLMFENGQGVVQDLTEAERLYRLAAKQGHTDAKNKLDVIIFNKELILAQQGNVEAEFILGTIYENGRGVSQNDAEAVRWYKLAATHGNASAQINLGLMYMYGRGVTQDDEEGIRLLRLGALQGDERAINALMANIPKKLSTIHRFGIDTQVW